MLDPLRRIVGSLASDPALLRLLRDDPQAFAQQLGLGAVEMQALSGAGEAAGRWGQGLASLARSWIASKPWLPAPSVDPGPALVDNRAGTSTCGGSGVPITSIVGVVGLVAAVGTVAVVALSHDDEHRP